MVTVFPAHVVFQCVFGKALPEPFHEFLMVTFDERAIAWQLFVVVGKGQERVVVVLTCFVHYSCGPFFSPVCSASYAARAGYVHLSYCVAASFILPFASDGFIAPQGAYAWHFPIVGCRRALGACGCFLDVRDYRVLRTSYPVGLTFCVCACCTSCIIFSMSSLSVWYSHTSWPLQPVIMNRQAADVQANTPFEYLARLEHFGHFLSFCHMVVPSERVIEGEMCFP